MAYESRERRSAMAILGIVIFAVAGCAHRAPAVIHYGTTIISGHNTTHANRQEAMQTVLTEAAAIAVDHGYRYFRVMTSVRPGADTTITLYGNRDVDPRAPGVYDAIAIGAGQIPASAATGGDR